MLVLLPVMSINSMLGDLRELFIASEWHGECSHSRRPCQNNARSKYVTQICRFYSDYMRSRILRIANRYESWDGNVRLPWTRRKWAWAARLVYFATTSYIPGGIWIIAPNFYAEQRRISDGRFYFSPTNSVVLHEQLSLRTRNSGFYQI